MLYYTMVRDILDIMSLENIAIIKEMIMFIHLKGGIANFEVGLRI